MAKRTKEVKDIRTIKDGFVAIDGVVIKDEHIKALATNDCYYTMDGVEVTKAGDLYTRDLFIQVETQTLMDKF